MTTQTPNGTPVFKTVGGDASTAVTVATGTTASRSTADRAADHVHIEDFQTDGSVAGDTAAFIAADAAVAGSKTTAVMRIGPNTTITGDMSDTLSAANKSIVLGEGNLSGFHRKNANAEYLPTPFMFPSTIRPEHLTRSSVAMAKDKVLRIAVQGDSIPSIGDNLISTADHPVWILVNEIKKQNPGVDVQVANYAIGGQTWNVMASDTAQPPAWFDNPNKLNWKQFVCAFNPDMIWLYSAGNDGYGFDAVSMQGLVQYYQTASNFTHGNVPDLIFGITYQPSIGSPTNGYNTTQTQNGIDFCATYIRNWCVANNYGYLDFGRWHAMVRDGVDPIELTMERVQPASGTTLPAYGQSQNTNQYTFPNATTGAGVNASSCTSWLIDFDLAQDAGSMEISLSGDSGNGGTPVGNDAFLLNDNGKVKYTYCDGVTRDVVAVTTELPWPTTASTWKITLKDGRFRVDLQQPLANGWDISNAGAKIMGMGMVTVCDLNVARFGAPFTPTINIGNAVDITVNNLCVADATTIQSPTHRGSQQRYRPIVSDYELYVEDDNAFGGSGSYHMNAYGYRLIFAPVIRAQNWSAVRFNSIMINTLVPENGGWTDVQGALQIEDWLNVAHFVNIGSGFGLWGTGAPAEQPQITGSKPTDPIVQQLLAACVTYGLVADKTT